MSSSGVAVHKPRTYRSFAWPVCRVCGLVYLKNDVTRKAIRAGCED